MTLKINPHSSISHLWFQDKAPKGWEEIPMIDEVDEFDEEASQLKFFVFSWHWTWVSDVGTDQEALSTEGPKDICVKRKLIRNLRFLKYVMFTMTYNQCKITCTVDWPYLIDKYLSMPSIHLTKTFVENLLLLEGIGVLNQFIIYTFCGKYSIKTFLYKEEGVNEEYKEEDGVHLELEDDDRIVQIILCMTVMKKIYIGGLNFFINVENSE